MKTTTICLLAFFAALPCRSESLGNAEGRKVRVWAPHRVYGTLTAFDHDTITEDLDFTYKLHGLGHHVHYDHRAICYTQDPATIMDYINQIRRWYGGGWQCLYKHLCVPKKTGMALELTLMYVEGMLFSVLLLALPFINIVYGFRATFILLLMTYGFIVYGCFKEKRFGLLVYAPFYVALRYLNAWIYLEQFIHQIIWRRQTLTWFQPTRVRI